MESAGMGLDFAAWVDRIVESAVVVLERKGLDVRDEAVRRILSARQGIAVDGRRVRFSARNVADFIEAYRRTRTFVPCTEFSVSAIGHANHIVDLEGRCRPITLEDIEEGARLAEALRPRGLTGSAPGVPQDVPPALQGILQLVAGARFSRSFPSYAVHSSAEAEEYIAECYQALGLAYPIGVHVVSPLRFEGQEIDFARHMLERLPDATVHIGTMPIMGMTAPASLLGGFVQGLAEVLGAGMMFQALGARSIALNVNLYAADMRTTAFVYGTPVNMAINILEVEMNQWLKTEVPSKSFMTMSQQPDVQAAAQKALFTGFMAAHGKRLFSGAGSLSVDEVYSPAQMVIDCEILGSVKRALEIGQAGLAEDHLLLDAILENADAGYLTDFNTAMLYPELQWNSAVFPSRMLQQAQAAGLSDVLERARDEARSLLAQQDYTLDVDKAAALSAIMARARANLG